MKYKFKIIVLLVLLINVLISCASTDPVEINQSENINKNLESNNPIQYVELNSEDKEQTSQDRTTIEDITHETSEKIDEVPIPFPSMFTTNYINNLFDMSYEDYEVIKDDNTRIYSESFYKYTTQYPMIYFDYNFAVYFDEDAVNTSPSYIMVTSKYEIEALREIGFNHGMSLNDVLELDDSFAIKQYWTEFEDYNRFYIEVEIDDYVYSLNSNGIDEEVWSIYISSIGWNFIENDYKQIDDLVTSHSDINCAPIFYTKGNLNNDNFEDIIITSVIEDSSQNEFDSYNQRVTMILLGNSNGYIKYGEVIGLIDSNTGAFGPPIVSVEIDDGLVSINQYGGSAWRNNILSQYRYDELDEKLYLDSVEFSSYHNVRPVQDTLTTNTIKYEKDYDILDNIPSYDDHAIDTIMIAENKFTISYEEQVQSRNAEEAFVNETIGKYKNQLIDQIRNMNVEGEFEINAYNQIKNDKVVSCSIYVSGHYNDYSKDIMANEYNSYYHDKLYVNIDLDNLKELEILDYYSVEEIAQALYESHTEFGNIEAYSIKTKEDIIRVVENSLNGSVKNEYKFDYSFKDLTMQLSLFLKYEDTDIIHERESVLIRTDDLIVESEFYKDWFNSTFQ
ncbi:MAG: hypothetical protein JEZ08_22420 [Clostridiales bacterium]|nr:hypothetical protein [Clostridiales bacterium]